MPNGKIGILFLNLCCYRNLVYQKKKEENIHCCNIVKPEAFIYNHFHVTQLLYTCVIWFTVLIEINILHKVNYKLIT